MQKPMKYIAIGQHKSKYPNPITFTKGTQLVIGNKYEGLEGWEDWYWCTILDHQEGWVPGELIKRGHDVNLGVSKDDYTARELEVKEGDELIATKSLNGWIWCKRLSDNEKGWVPAMLLQKIN